MIHRYNSVGVLALSGPREGQCSDVSWHHAHVSQSEAVLGHMDHLAHFSCFPQLFNVLVVSAGWTLGMSCKQAAALAFESKISEK